MTTNTEKFRATISTEKQERYVKKMRKIITDASYDGLIQQLEELDSKIIPSQKDRNNYKPVYMTDEEYNYYIALDNAMPIIKKYVRYLRKLLE